MSALSFVGILLTLLFVLQGYDGCDTGPSRQGCRIQDGACLCGIGCYNEYRYSSKSECFKALKGKRTDVCTSGPCFNNGACVQTSYEPGYRCLCEGTGFYGDRCENACPSVDFMLQANGPFPYECVVI